MAAAAVHRSTRSHDIPHFNSDTPRKRTRYSSNLNTNSRRSLASSSSRARQFRSPRLELDHDNVAFPSASSRRARRITSLDKPRYDSAADAAAAATGQVDGYKPREERSWEEFHQDLNLDAQIAVFSADEVDGISPPSQADGSEIDGSPIANGAIYLNHDMKGITSDSASFSPHSKRRLGRPPRRPESMLNGLGSPPAPKIVPVPAQNPREKLNLPKPSYRRVETFAAYEADKESNLVNYVDRTMANVGFQEFETFTRVGQQFLRYVEDSWLDEREPNLAVDADKSKQNVASNGSHNASRVEYDMDEQDGQWLDAHNNHRKESEQVDAIKPAVFEITMTQIEKEWHALERRIPKPNPKPPQTHRPRSSSAAAVNGEPAGAGEEQDTKCAICDDGDCENSNAIVFCDGCDLAVHQECYGVPFIPEGQWLCRKCQMIGIRSKPVCIFCPNPEGAFKQTTESRWAHLLCAIWIPEVSIANQTFMEPISDVAAVPRERWEKLTCYLCSQKMGACIQCGHRACYTAFHVTCAKKAKLYLRMKSSHGTGANLDASVLKAFCHKHVPPEWLIEHESDKAVLRAQAHYRKRFRNIEWADSMTSATTAVASQTVQSLETLDEAIDRDDPKSQSNMAALRKKRSQVQKNIWRLQSGAPVVPLVVQDAVEASLVRFGVRKRKEFVAEACKYWTMKRDSRRGAAMLKRLQIQLETFSANEVTRRNFAAMGPIGASRLERRIRMAERLVGELKTVQQICEKVKIREQNKLQDAELLKSTTDGAYFPIPGVIAPILRKARGLDARGVFLDGFTVIQSKLDNRSYTSILEFSKDLGLVFKSVAGLNDVKDFFDAHILLINSMPREEHLTEGEKEVKKLAKRIAKAIQQPIREALIKEAELGGPQMTQLPELMRKASDKDAMELLASQNSGLDHSNGCDHETLAPEHYPLSNSKDIELDKVTSLQDPSVQNHHEKLSATSTGPEQSANSLSSLGTSSESRDMSKASNQASANDISVPVVNVEGSSTRNVVNGVVPSHQNTAGPLKFLAAGGAPWYIEHFEPHGITLHEERWTGPEVLRGMSEELSEMDDEELQGIGPESASDAAGEQDVALSVPPRLKRRTRR